MPDPSVSVRLPDDLRLALDEAAADRHLSRSDYVREILRVRLRPVLVKRVVQRELVTHEPARRAG